MRKDMAKVLVEDGRINGGDGARKLKRQHRRRSRERFHQSPEEAPKREPMSGHRNYGWYAKELNEFLNPLQRFLESRVGQPWSKVYSEIRENLSPNNTVQMHIMQHLWQYVDRNVKVADCGTLVEAHRRMPYQGYHHSPEHVQRDKARLRYYDQFRINGRQGWKPYTRNQWPRFFIHPVTGILWDTRDKRLPEGKSFWPASKVQKKAHQEGYRHFVKEDGIWYELEIVPLPKGVKWGERGEVTKRTTVPPRLYRDKEVVPERVNLEYGPEDHFFGRVGGTESTGGRWSKGHVPPDLNQVKAKYGTLKVYCPVGAKRRQLGRKELRRLGLTNGDS